MKDNKRTILLASIAIFALIAIVGGATFAFFASTRDIDANLPVNTLTASKSYTFTSSANENIEFNISASEMSEASASTNVLKNDIANISVEVASANDDEITKCTYDIAWVWDSADKYIEADVTTLPHVVGDKSYPYELSVSVDGASEKDLSSYSLDSNNSFIIATGLTAMATSTTPVIDSHKIEVKAYNIPVDQKNLFNKKFQAHIEVRNVDCGLLNVDGDIAVLSSGSFYNSLTKATAVSSNFTDSDLTEYSGTVVNEDGLRYEGKNPNNYVEFNDELWRIIGVFDENTHGRSGEKLVKLIRAEKLPHYYQWGSTNNWNNSVIKNMLNTNYYNNQKSLSVCLNYDLNSCKYATINNTEGIKTDVVRNMIQPIYWKLGGTGSYDETTKTFYRAERGTTIPSSNGSTAVSTEELPIGLMYPSDYGYAVLESDCDRSTKLSSYSSKSTCYENNWLYNSINSQWTISPCSDRNDFSFATYTSGTGGNYFGSSGVYMTYAATPVIYLKQSIQITGGLGTIANPYTITM